VLHLELVRQELLKGLVHPQELVTLNLITMADSLNDYNHILFILKLFERILIFRSSLVIIFRPKLKSVFSLFWITFFRFRIMIVLIKLIRVLKSVKVLLFKLIVVSADRHILLVEIISLTVHRDALRFIPSILSLVGIGSVLIFN
jgi:hypothetical protein